MRSTELTTTAAHPEEVDLASYRTGICRPVVQLGVAPYTRVPCQRTILRNLVEPLPESCAALRSPLQTTQAVFEERAACTMVRTTGATSSTGDKNKSASSSAGRKRGREIHDSYKCAECFKVLLDPVTQECGHTLDKRCLHLLVAGDKYSRLRARTVHRTVPHVSHAQVQSPEPPS